MVSADVPARIKSVVVNNEQILSVITAVAIFAIDTICPGYPPLSPVMTAVEPPVPVIINNLASATLGAPVPATVTFCTSERRFSVRFVQYHPEL